MRHTATADAPAKRRKMKRHKPQDRPVPPWLCFCVLGLPSRVILSFGFVGLAWKVFVLQKGGGFLGWWWPAEWQSCK